MNKLFKRNCFLLIGILFTHHSFIKTHGESNGARGSIMYSGGNGWDREDEWYFYMAQEEQKRIQAEQERLRAEALAAVAAIYKLQHYKSPNYHPHKTTIGKKKKTKSGHTHIEKSEQYSATS